MLLEEEIPGLFLVCSYKESFRRRGYWYNVGEELVAIVVEEAIRLHYIVSHGYCPTHAEQAMQAIAEYRKRHQSPSTL